MRRARRPVVLLALTLLLSACAAGAGTARPEVVITQKEQFHVVTVHVGTLVEVRLTTLPGFNPWSRPVSSDPAVLGPVGAPRRPDPTGQLTIADYRALSAGTARLESAASVHCAPNQMCPQLVRAWVVSIRVE